MASTKRPRNILLTANKYQEKIILLTLFPSLLMGASFIGIVFIANPNLCNAVFHTSFFDMETLIHEYPWLVILLMCLILVASMIGAYVISLNMVGAFGRIIRELDEIIDGRSQKMITSRPGDDLSKDLLKRINVLVKFYVEKKGHK